MDDVQAAKTLAGTFRLHSAIATLPDGSKVEPFGPNPNGRYMLDGGRFMYTFLRAGLPHFASNNRMQGTAEENRSVVQGSVSGFGTYTVSDGAVVLKFEGSTFPNWTGTEIRQPLVSLTADEIKWRIPASGGGTAEVTLKRVR